MAPYGFIQFKVTEIDQKTKVLEKNLLMMRKTEGIKIRIRGRLHIEIGADWISKFP